MQNDQNSCLGGANDDRENNPNFAATSPIFFKTTKVLSKQNITFVKNFAKNSTDKQKE